MGHICFAHQPMKNTPLKDGEIRTVIVQVESFGTSMVKAGGQEQPCVKAEVSGDYEGTVYHLGGATKDGDKLIPGPLWKDFAALKLTIEGKLNKKTQKISAIVNGIEELAIVPSGAPIAAPLPLPEKNPEPAPAIVPPSPVQSTPQPTQPTKSMSKLKAKAPELVKPGKIKAVLYGISGVGKTTLALSFPKPYYFDVEGGAKGPQYRELLKKSGGAYMGPEDGTLSLDTLIEQMQALATEKHPYQTLIVDSLTKGFQTAIATEQERLGDRDAFGASKKPAIAAMRRIVLWASRLDMNIWFICHEASEWGMDKSGQRTEIGKIPDCWSPLIYELDLVIQAAKRGPQRIATVKKTRLTNFPDAETFPLEYAEFLARHGKEVIESDASQVRLATPEQITDLKKLLDVVRISEADIQKGFDKAGVSDWSEMTDEQISKWIDFLKKKLAS
jgi:hypothetical protein